MQEAVVQRLLTVLWASFYLLPHQLSLTLVTTAAAAVVTATALLLLTVTVVAVVVMLTLTVVVVQAMMMTAKTEHWLRSALPSRLLSEGVLRRYPSKQEPCVRLRDCRKHASTHMLSSKCSSLTGVCMHHVYSIVLYTSYRSCEMYEMASNTGLTRGILKASLES
jgi:hypothetical protein